MSTADIDDASQPVSAQCERLFYRLLRARTGIAIQEFQRKEACLALCNASVRFSYPDAMSYVLALMQQGRTEEWDYVISGITVNESYFFRDTDQMTTLKERILPQLIARKRVQGKLSLRIWSAGCARGQELYSIAILLHQLLDDYEHWHLQLLGTDIDTEALADAVQGRYTSWSMRGITPDLTAQYFVMEEEGYCVVPILRRLGHFSYLNLVEDEFPSLMADISAMDLILCRNVFIYLEAEAMEAVVQKMNHTLVEDGYLLLGGADPLFNVPTDLVLSQYSHRCYRRTSSSTGITAKPLVEAPVYESNATECLESHPADSSPVIQSSAIQDLNISPIKDYNSLYALAEKGHWGELLLACECVESEQGPSAILYQLVSKALASLGRYDEAEERCGKSLALDPVDKHTHLLNALILMEQQRYLKAESTIRKALFLDYQFLEAHYQLGLLLMSQSQKQKGLKSLQNALVLAQQGDPSWLLHDASGMTYGRFKEILSRELIIYQALP